MPAQGGEYNTSAWQTQRKRILARDGEQCRMCGRPGRTVDHMLPLRLWRARRGNEPYPDHLLQVLCLPCSGRKDGGRSYR